MLFQSPLKEWFLVQYHVSYTITIHYPIEVQKFCIIGFQFKSQLR